LPWAGTPATRPGCSKPHPTWPQTSLTSREGESATSLGILVQCLTTLTVKNFFLISDLNLPSFSFKLLPLVLSLHTLVKSPSPAFLQSPFRYSASSLLHAKKSQLSQPFLTEVFHPSNHFCGRPLDSLQQAHVFPMLRAPELDAGVQVGSYESQVERAVDSDPLVRIIFLNLLVHTDWCH